MSAENPTSNNKSASGEKNPVAQENLQIEPQEGAREAAPIEEPSENVAMRDAEKLDVVRERLGLDNQESPSEREALIKQRVEIIQNNLSNIEGLEGVRVIADLRSVSDSEREHYIEVVDNGSVKDISYLEISAKLPDGKDVVSAIRVLYSNERGENAHNFWIRVNNDYRDKGIASVLNRNLDEMYRTLGINHVTVDAMMEGRRAWARQYRFDTDRNPEQPTRFQKAFKEFCQEKGVQVDFEKLKLNEPSDYLALTEPAIDIRVISAEKISKFLEEREIALPQGSSTESIINAIYDLLSVGNQPELQKRLRKIAGEEMAERITSIVLDEKNETFNAITSPKTYPLGEAFLLDIFSEAKRKYFGHTVAADGSLVHNPNYGGQWQGVRDL